MEADKAEALKFIERHGSAIAAALEVAWNLREWLRESARERTLQPVLQSLLPGIRARLEVDLVEGGLSDAAAKLPHGDDLTAASLIGFVEQLQLPAGSLRIPAGEPPLKWETLSRMRAVRIAIQLCGEDCKPMFDADSEDDLNQIEAMDGFLLAELWAACLANENAFAKPVTKGQGDEANLTWQEVAERLERFRQQGEPYTSQPKLAKQFGCSPATINKAIRKTPSLKVWAKVDTTPKAQSINEVVTDSAAQNRELGPEDEAAIREYLERDDITPDERAFFNCLSPADQLNFLDDPDADNGILHKRILNRTP